MLSAFVIALFICFAAASELLKESTNTEIEAEDCAPRPNYSGILTIKVEYVDEDGDPINGVAGAIAITHQKIVDTMTCRYDNTHAFINFHLDANGKYQYTTPGFVHDNEADLFRVEVKVNRSGFFEGFRELQVATYTKDQLDFFVEDPHRF